MSQITPFTPRAASLMTQHPYADQPRWAQQSTERMLRASLAIEDVANAGLNAYAAWADLETSWTLNRLHSGRQEQIRRRAVAFVLGLSPSRQEWARQRAGQKIYDVLEPFFRKHGIDLTEGGDFPDEVTDLAYALATIADEQMEAAHNSPAVTDGHPELKEQPRRAVTDWRRATFAPRPDGSRLTNILCDRHWDRWQRENVDAEEQELPEVETIPVEDVRRDGLACVICAAEHVDGVR